MDSLKPKKCTISYPLTVFIVLSTALILTLPLTLPRIRTFLLPPCGHIVLISAARHGSSWLLNCAEGCYAGESFEKLNGASELWNRRLKGPVRRLSAREAGEYVEGVHSLKIFPLAYFQNTTRLEEFFGEVRARDVPVFLLKRRLEESFASYKRAQKSRIWNVNTVDAVRDNAGQSVAWGEGLEYATRVRSFFEAMRNALREKQVTWDELDYDVALEQDVIVGSRNRCVVRNCNMEQEKT